MLELIVLGQIPGTSFQFNLRELFLALALCLVATKLLLSRHELQKSAASLNKLAHKIVDAQHFFNRKRA